MLYLVRIEIELKEGVAIYEMLLPHHVVYREWNLKHRVTESNQRYPETVPE